jgi:hypothetical protein
MELFRSALSTPNPFPHGLFWTGLKNSQMSPVVRQLIDNAKRAGVEAEFVEVETFDAFMLRLWRNIDDKDSVIDAKVRKFHHTKVSIPLPGNGNGPIVRMNALPIASLPRTCQSLTFQNTKEWADLRKATRDTEGRLIFTKSDVVLCWGQEALIRNQFKDLISISAYDISPMIADIDNHLFVKGFLEEEICHALVRNNPLLTRTTRAASYVIVDGHSTDQSPFHALQTIVGKVYGQIAGLFAPVDPDHPDPDRVFWAEAVRVSIDIVDGRAWLQLDPDVWIWPPRAKKNAAAFLDERRGGRYNNVYNGLMEAWLDVLLGTGERATETTIAAYESDTAAETPSFVIGRRTAYTRKLAS